jgi:hypothetical protein
VIEVELRGRDVVDGALVVPFAHGFLVPGPLRPLQFTLRCLDGYLRQIGLLLAGEDLAPDLDLLPRQCGIEAVERCALALEFVLELRAVEDGEHLSLRHGVTGVHGVADTAGSDREEGGIDGCDHDSLGRDVANEVALAHGRGANALGRDDMPAVRP